MNKEKEAKGILEKVLTMLSGVDKEAQVEKDVVEEVAMSEESNETVEEEVVELAHEQAQEVVEEPIEAELSAEKPEEKYITSEDFDKFKAELTSIFKGKMEELEKEKVELSEQVVELSAEPSAEAIKHSPEMETGNSEGFQFAKDKPKGMLDNVLEQLNKYK
jgi:hypothetical protein